MSNIKTTRSARRVSKNPSGKYLQMNDEQVAREQVKFDRAVQRQIEKDAAKAAARKNA